MLYALNIIDNYGCNYVADTRDVFDVDSRETQWVKDYFIPKAVEYGCKVISFIIDKENSLADELKCQEEDSKDKIMFKYIYDLKESK